MAIATGTIAGAEPKAILILGFSPVTGGTRIEIP
jgi:hypothetical protein